MRRRWWAPGLLLASLRVLRARAAPAELDAAGLVQRAAGPGSGRARSRRAKHKLQDLETWGVATNATYATNSIPAVQAPSRGCPAGYRELEGGGVGVQEQLGIETQTVRDSAGLCAEDCDGAAGCLAFAWSARAGACSLSEVSTPALGAHEDYLVCRRLQNTGRGPEQADSMAPRPSQQVNSTAPTPSVDIAVRPATTEGATKAVKEVASRKRMIKKKAAETAASRNLKAAAERAEFDASQAAAHKASKESARQAAKESAEVDGADDYGAEEDDGAESNTPKDEAAEAAQAAAKAAFRNAAAAARQRAEKRPQRWEAARRVEHGLTPGAYRVVSHSVPVTQSEDRSSRVVAYVRAGAQVAVERVSDELVDGRVRALIASPRGWISLFHPASGLHLASRLA